MTPAYPAQLLPRNILARLTPPQLLVLRYALGVWLRPDQRPPTYDRARPWVSCTWIGGRGWGKSVGAASYVVQGVLRGEFRAVGLMAPTMDRAKKIQWEMLRDLSPPWCKPTLHGAEIRWPNGASATMFSAEAGERPRGSTYDIVWLTELLDWPESTRRDAFDAITTATRGTTGRYLCDTTSKGYNEVIQQLLAQAKMHPDLHHIRRGTTFHNPKYSSAYLRSELAKYQIGSRRFNEEIRGLVYTSAGAAMWSQAAIDLHRVPEAPPLMHVVVGCDPAYTQHRGSDETGIITAGVDARGHCYVTRDDSGKLTPDARGELVVDAYERGAAGAIVETNNLGSDASYAIKVAAEARGLRVEVVHRKDPIPQRREGTIYVKLAPGRGEKTERAEGPAGLAARGLVHHVGRFAELERELVEYEPGGKSPNRYDAYVQAIAEVSSLSVARPEATAEETTRGAAVANDALAAMFRGWQDGRRL